MFTRFCITAAPLFAVFTAGPAQATQESQSLSPASAFASLEGEWKGELRYRDYQSNRMESIPVTLDMEALPDGQTLIQRFDYTDPAFQVYITNLITIEGAVLTGATARAGRAFETYEKTIALSHSGTTDAWTIVMTSEALDDNRPAQIRETMVREGSEVTVTKEVDFLDDEAIQWEFRNVIELKRP